MSNDGSIDDLSDDGSPDDLYTMAARYPNCTHIPTGYEGKMGVLGSNEENYKFIVASDEGTIRMFDIRHMGKALNPYCVAKSIDSQPVRSVNISACGSIALVVSAGTSISILDCQDGSTIVETVRGDMYIKDATKTFGHTGHAKEAKWHPFDSERFASCGLDGTIRLWDTERKLHGIDQKLPQSVVFRMPDLKGRSTGSTTGVTCIDWSPATAKWMAGGTTDGCVGIWDDRVEGSRQKPQLHIKGCHESAIGSVVASPDDNTIFTRGDEDERAACVKVYDRRKVSSNTKSALALHTIPDLPPLLGGFLKQDMSISPEGKYLSVVEGPRERNGKGCISIWDTDTWQKVGGWPLGAFNNDSPLKVNYSSITKSALLLLDDGSVCLATHPDYSSKSAVLPSTFHGNTYSWLGKEHGMPDVEHKLLQPKVADVNTETGLIISPEDVSSLPPEYKLTADGLAKRHPHELKAVRQAREGVPQMTDEMKQEMQNKRRRYQGDRSSQGGSRI